MSRTTLQRRILKFREDAELTQDELAALVGLKDGSAVAHWELGDTSPRADLIPKIAKALRVTVAELYGEAAA